ncbi:class I SAM-dependent methyltransferase [Citricoccus sp. NPDC055426]|uniref:class I SAM-dependent DNA methyltransferase n=1 Tax=Citricoccus sp. NPDC055426 TaxID=3155536 RepID=UPI00342284BE
MTDASMTATHPGAGMLIREDVEDTGYGREFAPFYDRIFQHDESAEVTAEGLARIHPDISRGTLELGVGTGRIALPLARRIGPVDAIDSSVEMLSALEGHRKGEPVHAMHGNFVHELPDRRYGMVFAVCQTMSMVRSRAEQRRAMHRVAQALVPGGIFVVETGNPLQVHTLMGDRNPAVTTVPLEAQGGWLTTYSHVTESEAGDQTWRCRQVWIESDGTLHTGIEQSLLTPVEVMDRMAAEAGLVPELLFATWTGTPYGDEAPLYIRSYRRPTESASREGTPR